MCLNTKKIDKRISFVFFLTLIALVLMCGQSFGISVLDTSYRSSVPTQNGNPSRIAVDAQGALYVAAPESGSVLKIGQDGSVAASVTGFNRPLSVAVDGLGRLYVGDLRNGSVRVFAVKSGSSADRPLVSLGKGDGEFGIPGAIAIASSGAVYVTDSTNNVVKVYGSDGAFSFSFGGYGTDAGSMIFPTGIAVDDAAREVYVVDQKNGRVGVFDLNGAYKRSFGTFGSGQGQLTRPFGISVSSGNVYIADAYNSNVEVFDKSGNFVAYIGQYGSGPGDLRMPMDVVAKGPKVFIANSDNRRIEIFDVADQGGLVITPSALTFTAGVGMNPPSQTLQIAPAVAGMNVSWTASATASFIRLDQVSGTTGSGPSTVTVSIDTTGLAAGNYAGQINFTANGVDYPVNVALSVAQSSEQLRLFVSPGSLKMSYQRNGQVPTANLSITSSGGALQWTAAANVGWLSLSQTSGSTPGTVAVSLTPAAGDLSNGSYRGTVTVTAPNAAGSPARVSVTLKVSGGGTIIVKSNLDGASFTITGPTTVSGSGKEWRTDDAKAGSHTIAFNFIKGFRRPAGRTLDVKAGKTATVNAFYDPLPVANMIVAAKGPDMKNDALVRVFDLKGTLLSEFATLDTFYGAKVTTADIDGDGSDEIVVTPGSGAENRAFLKIFRSDGSPLSSTAPVPGTGYGANAAAGDVAGDGSIQIALSMVDQGTKVQTVAVYTADAGYALTEKTRITLAPGAAEKGSGIAATPYPASLAFGDIDGDGRLELIIVVANRIMVYGFNEGLSEAVLMASADLSFGANSPMSLSAGDVNGDGIDDIMLGYSDGTDSLVRVLKGDLTDYGLSVKVFGGDTVAAGLSSMDQDGDGIPEVLAGRGASAGNDAVVRVYGSGGQLLEEIRVFETAKYGANAAFGVKK